ncbi:hypothetical protein QBC34DRAFT_444081 [Podospora aff. communis PSN243]|uniref:C2H2-type domain-containing protein n=1 Tax=Podospora aff. communis PSN243 TaxID=3040156 RepID=A0AAV9G2F1_9PEZI|nr:hypothetical protein QBC34DRAFT_444081 [Podospora aff. communis PSN243]
MSPSPFPPSQAPSPQHAGPTPHQGGDSSGADAVHQGQHCCRQAIQGFGGALHVAAVSLGQRFGDSAGPIVDGILSNGDKVIKCALSMESLAREQLETVAAEKEVYLRTKRQLERLLASLTKQQKSRLLRCRRCKIEFATPDGLDNHDEKYHREDLSPAPAKTSIGSSFDQHRHISTPPASSTSFKTSPTAHGHPETEEPPHRVFFQHAPFDHGPARRPSDPHPLGAQYQSPHDRPSPPKRRCSEQHLSESGRQPLFPIKQEVPELMASACISPPSTQVQQLSSPAGPQAPVAPIFVFGQQIHPNPSSTRPLQSSSVTPMQPPHMIVTQTYHPQGSSEMPVDVYQPGNEHAAEWGPPAGLSPVMMGSPRGSQPDQPFPGMPVAGTGKGGYAHSSIPRSEFHASAPVFHHVDWMGTVPGQVSHLQSVHGASITSPTTWGDAAAAPLPPDYIPSGPAWQGEMKAFVAPSGEVVTALVRVPAAMDESLYVHHARDPAQVEPRVPTMSPISETSNRDAQYSPPSAEEQEHSAVFSFSRVNQDTGLPISFEVPARPKVPPKVYNFQPPFIGPKRYIVEEMCVRDTHGDPLVSQLPTVSTAETNASPPQ